MSAALDELAAEDRAVIELYVVRQLGDMEIAELLQIEVARVTDRRRRAFDRLAAAAGAESATERAEMMDALRVERAVAAEPAEAPRRGRPWGWLALLALGLAGLVAAILGLAGGEDEKSDGAFRERAAPTRGAAMLPPTGGPVRGFARLVREGERTRLSLSVRGLPDPGSDRYALWLYRSVTDARRLAGFPKGTFQADVPLPDGYERYRHLDVSREPDDSIPAHSGQSVLRVALRRLLAPVR